MRKEKKGIFPKLQKPKIEAEFYNNNKKYNWEKKKKSLIRFHSAHRISNYNQGEKMKKERKTKEKI